MKRTTQGNVKMSLEDFNLLRTFEERSSYVTCLKVDPFFDPVRSDPHSQSLLRRMNFAE